MFADTESLEPRRRTRGVWRARAAALGAGALVAAGVLLGVWVVDQIGRAHV